MEFKKDFDKWNTEKKKINQKINDKDFWFEIREVWWCSLGVNVGVEIDGKSRNFDRPALVVRVFNREGLYILPITTKMKNDKFHFQLKNFDKEKSFNSVVLTQLKFISSKRLLRKIGSVSKKDFQEIQEKVKEFL